MVYDAAIRTTSAASAASLVPAPRFTHAERTTLAVALLDSRNAVIRRSRLGLWIDRLLGEAAPQPLANPTLEALRVYALSLLRNDENRQARAFLSSHGFGADKLAVVRQAFPAAGTTLHDLAGAL